jgi:tetratricopeptide (TPR) repeat protein
MSGKHLLEGLVRICHKRRIMYSRFVKFIVACLVVMVCSVAVKATDTDMEIEQIFTPRLQLAYFEIQKLRLDKARTLLEQERSREPENGALAYLDNYADMYYLLISENKLAYSALVKKEDTRLATLEKMSDASPLKRLLMAEVRLHWAFAKLKFGNEVSACWDIIKAYRLLDENRKKYPAFVPTYKSLGLLHALIGSVPEQYTWVARALGMTGSVEEGVRELRLVKHKDPFFGQEAGLIELLLHAYTLRLSPDQIGELKALPAEHPDNLLLHFFATSVLMKEGKSEQALSILNKAPRSSAYIAFPFLDYLRAEIFLQKGQYQSAYTNYVRFQNTFKGFNFLKDSYFKQFLCLWLMGREQEADKAIARVGTVGKTIVESDQYAAKFAESYLAGQVLAEQKVLFVARYASDGGYLSEALETLDKYSEASFSSMANKAELNYRRGRILQKMGKPEQALTYFQRSILLTQNTNLYFGPSSALQMGYIHTEQSRKNQAIASFKKAMSYKKHEYKNSIDNKAKAALSKLGS